LVNLPASLLVFVGVPGRNGQWLDGWIDYWSNKKSVKCLQVINLLPTFAGV